MAENLFNLASSPALERHNVTVTSTMIKVTYNKPQKEYPTNVIERLEHGFTPRGPVELISLVGPVHFVDRVYETHNEVRIICSRPSLGTRLAPYSPESSANYPGWTAAEANEAVDTQTDQPNNWQEVFAEDLADDGEEEEEVSKKRADEKEKVSKKRGRPKRKQSVAAIVGGEGANNKRKGRPRKRLSESAEKESDGKKRRSKKRKKSARKESRESRRTSAKRRSLVKELYKSKTSHQTPGASFNLREFPYEVSEESSEPLLPPKRKGRPPRSSLTKTQSTSVVQGREESLGRGKRNLTRTGKSADLNEKVSDNPENLLTFEMVKNKLQPEREKAVKAKRVKDVTVEEILENILRPGPETFLGFDEESISWDRPILEELDEQRICSRGQSRSNVSMSSDISQAISKLKPSIKNSTTFELINTVEDVVNKDAKAIISKESSDVDDAIVSSKGAKAVKASHTEQAVRNEDAAPDPRMEEFSVSTRKRRRGAVVSITLDDENQKQDLRSTPVTESPVKCLLADNTSPNLSQRFVGFDDAVASPTQPVVLGICIEEASVPKKRRKRRGVAGVIVEQDVQTHDPMAEAPGKSTTTFHPAEISPATLSQQFVGKEAKIREASPTQPAASDTYIEEASVPKRKFKPRRGAAITVQQDNEPHYQMAEPPAKCATALQTPDIASPNLPKKFVGFDDAIVELSNSISNDHDHGKSVLGALDTSSLSDGAKHLLNSVPVGKPTVKCTTDHKDIATTDTSESETLGFDDASKERESELEEIICSTKPASALDIGKVLAPKRKSKRGVIADSLLQEKSSIETQLLVKESIPMTKSSDEAITVDSRDNESLNLSQEFIGFEDTAVTNKESDVEQFLRAHSAPGNSSATASDAGKGIVVSGASTVHEKSAEQLKPKIRTERGNDLEGSAPITEAKLVDEGAKIINRRTRSVGLSRKGRLLSPAQNYSEEAISESVIIPEVARKSTKFWRKNDGRKAQALPDVSKEADTEDDLVNNIVLQLEDSTSQEELSAPPVTVVPGEVTNAIEVNIGRRGRSRKAGGTVAPQASVESAELSKQVASIEESLGKFVGLEIKPKPSVSDQQTELNVLSNQRKVPKKSRAGKLRSNSKPVESGEVLLSEESIVAKSKLNELYTGPVSEGIEGAANEILGELSENLEIPETKEDAHKDNEKESIEGMALEEQLVESDELPVVFEEEVIEETAIEIFNVDGESVAMPQADDKAVPPNKTDITIDSDVKTHQEKLDVTTKAQKQEKEVAEHQEQLIIPVVPLEESSSVVSEDVRSFSPTYVTKTSNLNLGSSVKNDRFLLALVNKLKPDTEHELPSSIKEERTKIDELVKPVKKRKVKRDLENHAKPKAKKEKEYSGNPKIEMDCQRLRMVIKLNDKDKGGEKIKKGHKASKIGKEIGERKAHHKTPKRDDKKRSKKKHHHKGEGKHSAKTHLSKDDVSKSHHSKDKSKKRGDETGAKPNTDNKEDVRTGAAKEKMSHKKTAEKKEIDTKTDTKPLSVVINKMSKLPTDELSVTDHKSPSESTVPEEATISDLRIRPKSVDEKAGTLTAVEKDKKPKTEHSNSLPMRTKSVDEKPQTPKPGATPKFPREKATGSPPNPDKKTTRIIQCVNMFSGLTPVRKDKKESKEKQKRPHLVVNSLFAPDSPWAARPGAPQSSDDSKKKQSNSQIQGKTLMKNFEAKKHSHYSTGKQLTKDIEGRKRIEAGESDRDGINAAGGWRRSELKSPKKEHKSLSKKVAGKSSTPCKPSKSPAKSQSKSSAAGVSDKKKPVGPSAESHSPIMRREGVLYVDPKLPHGWKREIRHQQCGRIEVYIESPDGRKFRRRYKLEIYLKQENLPYNAEDFDFSIFGKPPPKDENGMPLEVDKELKLALISLKRKRSDEVKSAKKRKTEEVKSVKKENAKEFKIEEMDEEEKETPLSREEAFEFYRQITSGASLTSEVGSKVLSSAENDVNVAARDKSSTAVPSVGMYDMVRGLVLTAKLGNERSERRLSFGVSGLNCSIRKVEDTEERIPADWVASLASCRPGMTTLDGEAAASIAMATETFLQQLACLALQQGGGPDVSYDDIADVIADTPCLEPLRTLIPRKISFKQFRLLNRPTKYFSFKV